MGLVVWCRSSPLLDLSMHLCKLCFSMVCSIEFVSMKSFRETVGAPHIAQQRGEKPFSAGECTAKMAVWSDAQPRSWEIEDSNEINVTQKDTQTLPEPNPETPPPPPKEPEPVAEKVPGQKEPEPLAAQKVIEPAPVLQPPITPVDPQTPCTVPATASQVEAAKLTPPPVISAPSPALTPTEPEEETPFDSISAAPPASGGRDPGYWKLRRYFTPKASGELKCTAEAMKLWKTPQGRFWVIILNSVSR